MFAEQFAGAIDCANFTEISNLSHTLWKAYDAGHLTEDEAQNLSDRLEARRKATHGRAAATSFHRPKAARPTQRSPDRQRSIERRRRMAKAAPIPPEHVDKFTVGEAACIAVIAGEIARHGVCDLSLKEIADIAGCRSKTTVRSAVKKMRNAGLGFSQERRRAGQKSLTNVIRAISKPWAAFLKRWRGYKKEDSSTYKDIRNAHLPPVDKTATQAKPP
jgi:hypothetical protein